MSEGKEVTSQQLDFQAEFPDQTHNSPTKKALNSGSATAKAPAVVPVIQQTPTTSTSKNVVTSGAQLVLENTNARQSLILHQ